LARLAINFKNAGNGGFFNVFEVPQMENGRWKMRTANAVVFTDIPGGAPPDKTYSFEQSLCML
jgi:hypothetical protein